MGSVKRTRIILNLPTLSVNF